MDDEIEFSNFSSPPTDPVDEESGRRTERPRENHPLFRKKHGCTDLICAFLFLILIGSLGTLGYFAYQSSRPHDFVSSHDQSGRICGRSPGVEDKKYLLFYDFTKCLNFVSLKGFGCPTEQICVSECPSQNAYEKIPQNKEILQKYCDPFKPEVCPTYLLKSKPIFGRCLPEIITDLSSTLTDVITADDLDTDTPVPIEVELDGSLTPLTVEMVKDSVRYVSYLDQEKTTLELILQDLFNSRWIILISVGVATVLALIACLLLRILVKPPIYVSMILVVAALAGCLYFSISQYMMLKKNETGDLDSLNYIKIYDSKTLQALEIAWLVLAGFFSAVLALILVSLFLLRKNLGTPFDFLKEIKNAAIHIPLSLLWAIVPIVLFVVVVAGCAAVSFFVASSGIHLFKVVRFESALSGIRQENGTQIYSSNSTSVYEYVEGEYCFPEKFYATKDETVDGSMDGLECLFYRFGFDLNLPTEIDSESTQKYYKKQAKFFAQYQWAPQVFVLVMIYWLGAFVVNLNKMTLAGAFNSWYWTGFENGKLKNDVSDLTLIRYFCLALFVHTGTLAFESFLSPIIKLTSVLFEYGALKFISTRERGQLKGVGLGCRLKCFKKWLEYLNKYSPIVAIVFSFNYIKAAREAFELISPKAVHLIGVQKLIRILLMLSNLLIAALVGVLAFAFFTQIITIETVTRFLPDLNFYLAPIVCIIVLAYFSSKCFFDVFNMGTDSIFLCFLIDIDENKRSSEDDHISYVPIRLARLLEKKGIAHCAKISNRQQWRLF